MPAIMCSQRSSRLRKSSRWASMTGRGTSNTEHPTFNLESASGMPPPFNIGSSRLNVRCSLRFSGAMHVSFNLAADVEAAVKAAAVSAGLEDAAAFAPDVRTADPRHGDYQANGVLAYAKARKLNPRGVAEKLIAALPAAARDAYDVSIAGPGFINFSLKPTT